jgi:TRAP-type mannitol/chloroaromatic compound transport system substrate-binding protein
MFLKTAHKKTAGQHKPTTTVLKIRLRLTCIFPPPWNAIYNIKLNFCQSVATLRSGKASIKNLLSKCCSKAVKIKRPGET